MPRINSASLAFPVGRTGRTLAGFASFCVLVLAGCHQAPVSEAGNFDPPSIARPMTSVRTDLIPGDEVELFVMEDEKFNGRYTIREGGDIILPKVGRVKISGTSAKGAESTIKAVLENNQLTKATVIVDRVKMVGSSAGDGAIPKLTVFLSGAVNRAGQHDIAAPNGSVGAYEALIIGGGVHRYGDERKIRIMRRAADGSRKTINVDLEAIKSGKTRDIPLQQGDILVVPEKTFVL